MSLPIKPVCKKALVRKDGTSIIFIQYCHSLEKRTLLNSGIAIPPSYWNLKQLRINADLPLSYGNAGQLNEQLQNAIRVAEDILTFAARKKTPDLLSFLKKTFRPDFDLSGLEEKGQEAQRSTVNLDVYFQIEEYILSKRKQVTPKAISLYQNLRDTLKAFEGYRGKPITFESFDISFYEAFVEYMMYEHVLRRRKKISKGFRMGTIGRTIKQLRVFLRNRMRRKIIPAINLEDFKIISEETDAVYISQEEIKRIYQTDLSSHPHLIKFRNLFVFGCLTGLRFSDFSTIRPEDIRNRMLYKKQNKSDHWVVIPLREEAYNIFLHEFNRNIPPISNGDFNNNIKEVAKLAGIDQLIKFSHKKGNQDIVTVKPKYELVS